MIKKIEKSNKYILKDGTIEYRLSNGVLHREDGPAIIYSNGTKQWWQNGLCHREDGPAIEREGGYKEWWLNGKRHRADGPAAEDPYGVKQWYLNGLHHRVDGPAADYANGFTDWYISGYCIYEIKLDLTRDYDDCIGQFLYSKDKDYLIFCFEKNNYYFYIVLWDDSINIDGKRYDCRLAELKSLL